MNIVERSANIINQHEEKIYKQIQEKEQIPAGTEVIACSLDGTNVLIREKGIKMGKIGHNFICRLSTTQDFKAAAALVRVIKGS